MTFGYLSAEPGSSNTVPGKLEITVDIRHPDAGQYRQMLAAYAEVVASCCASLHLDYEAECFWEAPGIEFDSRCIDAVRAAASGLALPRREMFSGAGHDACNLSAVVPTSMIFIPCEGGLSHNEAEHALPEHIAAGADVLLHAMMALAGAD
jgi:N-carbamoyl-L-amino-acid hydrolase